MSGALFGNVVFWCWGRGHVLRSLVVGLVRSIGLDLGIGKGWARLGCCKGDMIIHVLEKEVEAWDWRE